MRATEPLAKQRLLQITNSDLVLSIVDNYSTVAMLAFARYSVLHRLSQAAAPVGAVEKESLTILHKVLQNLHFLNVAHSSQAAMRQGTSLQGFQRTRTTRTKTSSQNSTLTLSHAVHQV